MTRKRIISSFKSLANKKRPDKVTIDEIISAAGVSKQTFYKYFDDKYALIFAVYMEDMDKVLLLGPKLSFREINRAMLNILHENRSFYKNVFMDSFSPHSFFRQYHKISIDWWASMIGKYRATEDILTLADMYTYGTQNLIAYWLVDGKDYDIEWMLDMFERSMPQELKALLLS